MDVAVAVGGSVQRAVRFGLQFQTVHLFLLHLVSCFGLLVGGLGGGWRRGQTNNNESNKERQN